MESPAALKFILELTPVESLIASRIMWSRFSAKIFAFRQIAVNPQILRRRDESFRKACLCTFRCFDRHDWPPCGGTEYFQSSLYGHQAFARRTRGRSCASHDAGGESNATGESSSGDSASQGSSLRLVE